MSKYTYLGYRWWKFDFLNHNPLSSDFGATKKFSMVKAQVCLQIRKITMVEWFKWICLGEDNNFKLKRVAIHE
ncbi:MAG: hypothetical protein ABSB19_02335 [Methylomonas sp.]|jgi:hypothetical protein